MVRVIYRWQVEPGDFDEFRDTWRATTNRIHETVDGALGSFLLRSSEDDSTVVTIAKWKSLDAWKAFWGNADPEAMARMRQLGRRVSAEVFEEVEDQTRQLPGLEPAHTRQAGRAMNRRSTARFAGSVALVLSVLAFALGSAPFTPALLLTFVAGPLAIIAIALGAWRLGLVGLYFAGAAWLALPPARALALRVDVSLVVLAVVGVAVAGIVYRGRGRRPGDA